MEIEKPKVQDNKKNLNENRELLDLVYTVFEQNAAGKRLLAKLKELYISDRSTAMVFPGNIQAILQKFGSIDVYSGFKAGQASVIFGIETIIEEYKQMELNNQSRGSK